MFISCLHFDWFLSNFKMIAIRVIISNLKIGLKYSRISRYRFKMAASSISANFISIPNDDGRTVFWKDLKFWIWAVITIFINIKFADEVDSLNSLIQAYFAFCNNVLTKLVLKELSSILSFVFLHFSYKQSFSNS